LQDEALYDFFIGGKQHHDALNFLLCRLLLLLQRRATPVANQHARVKHDTNKMARPIFSDAIPHKLNSIASIKIKWALPTQSTVSIHHKAAVK
jgi:hypothetical protein